MTSLAICVVVMLAFFCGYFKDGFSSSSGETNVSDVSPELAPANIPVLSEVDVKSSSSVGLKQSLSPAKTSAQSLSTAGKIPIPYPSKVQGSLPQQNPYSRMLQGRRDRDVSSGAASSLATLQGTFNSITRGKIQDSAMSQRNSYFDKLREQTRALTEAKHDMEEDAAEKGEGKDAGGIDATALQATGDISPSRAGIGEDSSSGKDDALGEAPDLAELEALEADLAELEEMDASE